MSKVLFSLVLVVSTAVPAFAQALPFVKAPVSQEGLAKAIEIGDMSILNISPNDYLRAVNEALGLELESHTALASYIRQLNRVSCPEGREATLGRVLKTGALDLHGFKRSFVEGEECLLDTNTARYVVSLLCGNVITATTLPIFGAVPDEPVIQDKVSTVSGPPIVDYMGPGTKSTSSTSPSWLSRNKKRIIKVGIGTAIAAGAVALFRGLGKQEQSVVITIGR